MSDESGLAFQIEGRTYLLDDFELGELEWLEEQFDGMAIEEAVKARPMKAAVCVVYIVRHREDESFTLEDARKLKLTVFDDGAENGGPPPKPARAAGSSRRAKSGAAS